MSGLRGIVGQYRSASSFKTLMDDVSVKDILETGEGSRESTFYNFYGIVKLFARAILEPEGS